MVKNKNQNGRHSYIFTRETLGMTVLLFCGLMLLMLLTYNAVFSGLGVAVCTFMYGTFGYGSYLVLAALACLGVWLVFEKKPAVRLRTAAAVGITLAVLFMLFHAVTTRDFDMNGYGAYLAECYSSAESGFAGYTFGGVISGLIVYPIARGTTFIGAYVIFSILLALCGYLTFLVVRMDVLTRGNRRTKAATAEQTLPAAGESVNDAADNAYVMNEGYEIVNNMANAPQAAQPEAAQPVPPEYGGYAPYGGEQQSAQDAQFDRYGILRPSQPQPSYAPAESDEDKFAPENLGRKILFDNGEFAAESYRRNMIFNDDSYFNHPVHNEGDYLSSFSSGGKRPSAPPAAPREERPQSGLPSSYTQSYASEAEERPSAPPTPSYIYGDKPAQSLDDFPAPAAPAAQSSPSYDDGDYDDDITYGDDYYEEDPAELPVAEDDEPSDDRAAPAEEPEEELPPPPAMRRGEEESTDIFGRGENSFTRPTGREEPPARRATSFTDGIFADDEPERGDSLRGAPADGDLSAGGRDIGLGRDRGTPSFDRMQPDGGIPDGGADISRGAAPRADDDIDISPTRGEGEGARPSNDLRSIFSSSNSAISDDVKPDATRLGSRREGARGEDRENMFDDDGDDYLTDDGDEPADFGVRGLRSDDGDDFSARRGDGMSVSPVRPVTPQRREETPPPEPPKPKHVWKKYARPSLDLLADYPEGNNANLAEIEENKSVIIDTLENFRIGAHISDVTIGPAITRYDVIIEDRTNIKSAMRYRDAIAMALMKENVTTYLNYSKGAISIEVPNSKRTTVGLKSILMSSDFINSKANSLTFALGKDVEGKPNCPDITKMPHLLVAGTTGSGKSICLSSLIISLLFKYGPDELRFILVDPKQSEFISYEGLPHLIVNEIISDVDKAIKALNWAIKEMERRYALFKEMTLAGTLVKNLNEYNAHLPEGEEKLPKIVVILDEFGDLMLQSKKDIETRIIRLVQKSRAAGIHLILATQRPSVDCITGLIKSNLPTRIGFKVNSFDDSRTIFDIGGAEKLLGAGDMYYRSAQNPDLMRIQGCFIDSPEVQAVTDFVKKNNETYFDQSVSDFINTVEEGEGSDGGEQDGGDGDVKIDDKFIQALKFCVTSNQASVSMLQRRFPIGYVKACKIIDWMENMNYITQSEGAKPRKVLLSLDEFTRIYGEVDD